MTDGMEFMDLAGADDRVIAARIAGQLTADDMAEFNRRLDAIVSSGGKARIYLEIEEIPSFDLGVIKEKWSNMGHIWSGVDRVAYVVDSTLLDHLVGLIDLLTPMHFRAFNHEQVDEARTWLLGE